MKRKLGTRSDNQRDFFFCRGLTGTESTELDWRNGVEVIEEHGRIPCFKTVDNRPDNRENLRGNEKAKLALEKQRNAFQCCQR